MDFALCGTVVALAAPMNSGLSPGLEANVALASRLFGLAGVKLTLVTYCVAVQYRRACVFVAVCKVIDSATSSIDPQLPRALLGAVLISIIV